MTATASLRLVQPEDLPILFEQQLDPVANDMAYVNPRDHASFHAHWEKIFRDPTVIARGIWFEDQFVGLIGSYHVGDLTAVGYSIARPYWGRGLATQALTLLLREVTTRPLHATVAKTNIGSIRVLEKCGFVYLGSQWSEGSERYRACEEAIYQLN